MKKLYFLLAFLVLFSVTGFGQEIYEEDPVSAAISTLGVTELTPTSAKVMGYIDPTMIAGFSSAMEVHYGFYCGTSPDLGPGTPCIYRIDNYLESATTWYHTMTWLQEQTTYYVRSFYRCILANDTLIGYGNELSFTTPPCASATEAWVSACGQYAVINERTLFQESFDTGSLPTGWTLLDADGDGYYWWVGSGISHSGSYCMASASYDNSTGALLPDNWLITPAITVPDTGSTTLSWWVAAKDQNYVAEHYDVLVSTTTNAIADFNTNAIFGETMSSIEWSSRTVNLTQYAGQTIYIAFVHRNCSDMFWLKIDDIAVSNTDEPYVYTESGDYPITYTNQYGCDSVVTMHLTISQGSLIGTHPAQNITSNSANLGGYLELLCGNEQPQLGVCYSTSPNPTVIDDYVMALLPPGSTVPAATFSQTIEGLAANTTYYVRAFGVTSESLIYGPEVTFTTYGYAILDGTVTSAATGLPIAGAEVMLSVAEDYYEGGQHYWYRGEMIIDTFADSNGHFTIDSIVMSGSTVDLFLDLWADGYQHRMYVPSLNEGYNNRSYTMLLEPCYEVPYWVYWEEQTNGSYRLSWWALGYDPDEPVDPQYPNPLTYNVYENGTLIAEGLTNQWYMLPSFNASSCYQVKSICTNGALSDTSECATIKPVPPTVVTYNPTEITGFTAVLNGEITSDGNAEIYSRGFYINTIPTLDSGNVNFYYVGDMSYVLSEEAMGLEPETTYYVWAYAFNQAGESYGNMLSFTTTRACYAPENFYADEVLASSALLKWTNVNEATPAYYELSYKANDADSWTVVSNITTNAYLLSGLQQQTAYMVRIRTFCEAGVGSPYASLSFSTTCVAGSPVVTIGEGTTSSSGGVLPTNIYYKYSYSQQIYKSNEIGVARTIGNIGLQYFYSTSYSRNLEIYLVHTDKTSFTGNNDWVSVAGVQPVFSGYVNFTSANDDGWVNISLTTPFEYNGNDNVVLVVNDKTGSYFQNGEKFYTHNTSQYSSLYAYRDGSAYSPSSPGSSSGRVYYRNNLRIPGVCLSEGCDRSNVAVVSVSDTSAQLSIAAGTGVQAVELEYKAEGDNVYTPIAVEGDSYTLTGLTPNADYELRIRSVCTGDSTEWKTVNFTTLVSNMDRLYVKTDGTGDGSSWEQATNDLSTALAMAALVKEGYGTSPEIWVAEGTYYGNTSSSYASFILNNGTKLYGGFAGTETSIAERDIQAHPTILDGQNNQRVLYHNYDYYNYNDLVVVDGFTVRNGYSYDAGGGAYLYGNFEVRNCRFLNNEALSSGGAVYVSGNNGNESYNFINCEFNGNRTVYQGGAVCNFSDRTCFFNCKISGNYAEHQGGGIYGGRKMVNCEISNNTAELSSGVYDFADSLVNCDIVGNVSTGNNYAGLMGFHGVMINTVVWGNIANNQPCNIVDYTGMTAYNSAVAGLENYEGVINLSANNFGSDANQNYPFFVSPENADYRLRSGSALIDAGTAYNNLPAYDMAGESRVYGNAVEIGCYEFHNEAYCLEPLDLEVSSVMNSSVLVSWRDGGNMDSLLNYELSYKVADAADWTVLTETPQTTYKMLTGLLSDTTYIVRMRSICNSGQESDYTAEVTFHTLGSVACALDANGDVFVPQEPQQTSNYGNVIPTDIYYKYSLTQQIYYASELGGEAMINSMAFQYFYGSSYTRDVDIYLGHTSMTSFDTGNDWVPLDDMLLVYSGNVTFTNSGTNNWFNIDLQNNFEYNGVDNLVVMMVDKTGNYQNSNNKFYTHEVPVDNTSIHICTDGGIFNPEMLSTYTGTVVNYRNNLKLHGQCENNGCERPNLVVMDVTSNSAKLVYAPAASATGCELQYGVEGSEEFVTMQPQNGECLLTGLRYNTTYEARIRSFCDEDSSSWKIVRFTTPLIELDRLYVTMSGTGDGSSWANATNDLTWAMNTAMLVRETFGTATEVWVAEGTYYGGNGTNAFTMVEGVNVYGGFAGTETELSQRDINNHPTVLDGQNIRRVLWQPSTFNERTVWDGFTLQNGNVTNFSNNSNGGGAYLRGNGVLRHCTIINNAATYGAGFYSEASSSNNSELESCKVSHNTATYNAGGVYAHYTKVSRCEISYNKTTSSGGQGGGIYMNYGNSGRDIISNCLIANNKAGSGAGVYAYNNTRISNSTIVNNAANYYGAGIYGSGTVTMTNSIVWGNRIGSIESSLYNSVNCQNCAIEGAYAGTNVISLFSEPNPSLPYYPYFVNPSQTAGSEDATANVDWRLTDGSICVNRGNNEMMFVGDSLDMDGNARVQKGTVDLGCYESTYNGITLPEYNGIVYVKENGTGNGTSWNNAMSSLSDALSIASTYNAVIWVAAGTYYGDSISPNAFVCRDGVNVYGGFAGNEPANYNLSLRDFTAHATILDGQHNQRIIGQNTDFTTRTVWDGFVLQNGYAHQDAYNTDYRSYGGGAFLMGNMTLRNCIVRQNRAQQYGGGVYVRHMNSYNTDTTFLINCTLSYNTSESYGGGAYFEHKTTAYNSEFSYNRCQGSGGGIYGGQMLLSECLIANNTSSSNGGGIYNYNSYGIIRNSTIVNNAVVNTGTVNQDYGGGIYAYYNTMVNCIVWGNMSYGEVSGIAGNSYTASNIASDNACNGSNNLILSVNNDESLLSPHFVNPSATVGYADETENVDWHLQQGSPCVNRGDNSVAGAYDLDGHARVQNDTIDLGCYESPYNGVQLPSYNGIVYVKQNGAGNGSGDSWENAMPSIKSALNVAAVNNAKVWVAAGTYYGDGVSVNAFVIKPDVNVYGGFAGNEPADYDLSLRDFDANASVLDGQYSQRVLYQKEHFTANTAVVWDGFTIQNGRVNDNGAGVFMRAYFTLRNCVVQNNVIASPTVTSSNRYGAGVYAYGSNSSQKATVSYCKISHNGFENANYGNGAGLYTVYTNVDHTEISHNAATRSGGGVYAYSYSSYSNCLIDANTAQYYGGGLYISNSNFSMINCDVVNNMANSTGGGIYSSNNSPTISNSIVWGNKQGYVVNNFNSTSMTNVTYCAVEGDYQGEGNINLASTNDGNDGTAYYVRFTDPQHENFQLHPTSSCVNVGNASVVTESVDFYGNSRMIGENVDMGCSEVQEETSCTSVINLTAGGITTNSAQLSWQPTGTETQWVVVYGETNSSETTSLTINNEPTCSLQGLSFNRQYTAKVRALCGGEMMSVFSIPVNFQTTCDPGSLDTLEEFSSMLPADNSIIYNNNVTFNWAAMSHATSYDFYLWKTTENEPATPTHAGLVQPNYACTLPGYSPGVSYNWKVVAWNECISKTSEVMTIQVNWNPDLHVSAVTTSTPVSTQPMTVTWTVINDGQGNTPPGSEWYDYIWLTPVDGIGDGFWYNVSEVKLATVPSLNGLNAGESYTNSVEVTIPEGYVGSYYLFVLTDQPNVRDINYAPTGGEYAPDPYTPSADGNPYPYLSGTIFHFYNNNVVEQNDADNFFYKVITILPPPSPDLEVTSVVHGGDATSGHEASVTWTVTNQGEAAAMGSWVDAVYFSSDTLLDTQSDFRVGRFTHEGPLAINESYQRTDQFTVPVDYNGDYYFIVVTDNNNSVYEGLQEMNNITFSSPMHVTLSWFTDLEVSDMTMTDTVDANGDYYFEYTVVNNGASPTNVSSWYDAIYISQETILNVNSGILLGKVYHSGVVNALDMENPENSSYHQRYSVHIPENISGNWNLFLLIDVDEEVFEYNAEYNNSSVYHPALTVLNPDLTVTNVELPDVIDPNEPVRIQWTVRNVGPGNLVNRSFKDKFFVNGNQFYVATVNRVSIPAGESIVRSATVRIPCVNAGTAELTIVTDEESNVTETVETNNSLTENLQISAPDFVMREVVPVVDNNATNGYLWSGTSAELTYKVANMGQAAVSHERVKDKIYFNTSSDSYQASDLIYTNVHAVDLAVGDSVTYTCTVTIPNGISGMYYYHVVCNTNDTICEGINVGSNVNASDAVEVMLSPSPDLIITSVTAPSQVYIGTDIELFYTVKNQGETAVNSMVTQKFYYSTSPYTYSNTNLLGSVNDYLHLGVNDSVSNVVHLTMPTNVNQAAYFIHAVADANDQIYEHNHEDNNTTVSNSFNALTYELDLQLTQIEGPDVMQWGETAICTLHVQNNSSLPTLASSWRDVVYLSPDNVLHSTDQLMQAQRHTVMVAGGADYEVTIEVTIPFGTPATAYLIGVTDFDNNNPDVNVNNNVLIKQLTINTVPTPDLAVSEVVVLGDVYAGQPARLAYKVTNVSETAISSQTWNDRLFLSYNDTYESNDLQLLNKNRREMTLAQNEFYRDTLNFTVPLPNNGHLYLLMMANAGNNPFEAVQTNNTVAVPVDVVLPLPGDLVVTEVSCESSVVSGQTLHANWMVKNIGDNTLMGRGLRSLVYISTDTEFDANDRLLGSVTTTSVSLGIDATLQQSLASRVSGLAPGNYYLIVKTDVTNAFNEVSDDNNTGHTLYPFEVTIRPLPFNENVYDTLINNEVSDYMLNVGDNQNQTVRIHVASEDSLLGAVNMIYATYNAMGDNLNYSYSTIGQFQANSELYIPSTQPGYYGVNIYGSTPTNLPQNTIVRADILPFELRAVNDDHGGNTGVVTVELTGSRFRPDMRVTMRHGNEVIAADTVIYVSYYQVFAQFDLTGHTPGTYDVSAVNFCEGEAVLANGFTIEEGQPSGLSYNLLFPSSPRPNRNVVMMLEFGNIGNVDLHNQVLEITSLGGCPIALTPDGISLHQTVLQVPLSIEGEPAGLLRPGSYGTLNIYGYTSGALMFTIKPVQE